MNQQRLRRYACFMSYLSKHRRRENAVRLLMMGAWFVVTQHFLLECERDENRVVSFLFIQVLYL